MGVALCTTDSVDLYYSSQSETVFENIKEKNTEHVSSSRTSSSYQRRSYTTADAKPLETGGFSKAADTAKQIVDTTYLGDHRHILFNVYFHCLHWLDGFL